MSRKDFKLIAATIKALDLGDSTDMYVATMFAEALATTNPRFNKTRFIEACIDGDKLWLAELQSQVESASTARIANLREALA